jgi:hypothetical protein
MNGHGSLVQRAATASNVGRPKKFTPERIQQIINLVERGKSPAEIADIIGVPIGSLAVTCSRLGISLRRPLVNNGLRLLRPAKPYPAACTDPCVAENSRQGGAPFRPVTSDVETAMSSGAHKPAWAEFMIQMKYNGRERTLPLPLTPGMIKHLALEAAVRNLRMGELIRELVISTIGRISRASTTDAFDDGDHGARRSAA